MSISRETFRSLYEDELMLLKNSVCRNCSPKYKHPLLPWIVGEKYWKTDERLLFIGKPHRGIPGSILDSGIIDPTDEIEGDKGLWSWNKPYWRYTKDIAEEIYGETALQSIALSNVVKCSNTDERDQTTWDMASKCIAELGVIWREMEVLKPRNIVCYTYSLFPELLREVPIALPGTTREITGSSNRVPCGEKLLGWWDRAFQARWGEPVRLLVLGHPERMAKADYITRVCRWVRGD